MADVVKGAIEQALETEFKQSLRQKDALRVDVIRLLRTEVAKAKSAPGFSGPTDDKFYLAVISAYAKKITKAQKEYEQLGERGEEMATQLQAESDFLARWMPKKIGEAETRALVKTTIAELGLSDAKMAGRVVGHLMKSHKDELDGGLVKQIATEELS